MKVNNVDQRRVIDRNEGEVQEQANPVQFEEEGEIVEMEIDDRGEAASEFASDHEEEQIMSDQGEFSDAENIPSHTEDCELVLTPTQQGDDNMQHLSASKKKVDSQPSTSTQRDSVEERLDTMSSTLLAMKQIMEKSGMLETPKNDKKGKGQEGCPNQSNSETTIYHNVLQKE